MKQKLFNFVQVSVGKVKNALKTLFNSAFPEFARPATPELSPISEEDFLDRTSDQELARHILGENLQKELDTYFEKVALLPDAEQVCQDNPSEAYFKYTPSPKRKKKVTKKKAPKKAALQSLPDARPSDLKKFADAKRAKSQFWSATLTTKTVKTTKKPAKAKKKDLGTLLKEFATHHKASHSIVKLPKLSKTNKSLTKKGKK